MFIYWKSYHTTICIKICLFLIFLMFFCMCFYNEIYSLCFVLLNTNNSLTRGYFLYIQNNSKNLKRNILCWILVFKLLISSVGRRGLHLSIVVKNVTKNFIPAIQPFYNLNLMFQPQTIYFWTCHLGCIASKSMLNSIFLDRSSIKCVGWKMLIATSK